MPASEPGPATRLFVLLQYLLPHHLLSHLVGLLADCPWSWVKNPLIRLFMRAFQVNLSEAECQHPAAFASFNAFFTRSLRPTARPIDVRPQALLSPADGAVSACGLLAGDRVLQAKNHSFSLGELLGSAEEAERYCDGSFATIYLSPRDYHRVHMPCAGTLQYMRHIPGRLFSVNAGTTQLVDRLFARNERLICSFVTDNGPMTLVLVGAMIVASIETVWAGRVVPPGRRMREWRYDRLLSAPSLEGGAEMGRFLLGSTVIALFPAGVMSWQESMTAGRTVRMGECIGNIVSGN